MVVRGLVSTHAICPQIVRDDDAPDDAISQAQKNKETKPTPPTQQGDELLHQPAAAFSSRSQTAERLSRGESNKMHSEKWQPKKEDVAAARQLLKEWTLERYLNRVTREPVITLTNDTLLGA